MWEIHQLIARISETDPRQKCGNDSNFICCKIVDTSTFPALYGKDINFRLLVSEPALVSSLGMWERRLVSALPCGIYINFQSCTGEKHQYLNPAPYLARQIIVRCLTVREKHMFKKHEGTVLAEPADRYRQPYDNITGRKDIQRESGYPASVLSTGHHERRMGGDKSETAPVIQHFGKYSN